MIDFLRNANVDALRDLYRVIARFRQVGPKVAHLRVALHVELIGVKLHPARVGDGLSRADAKQHVVRRGVALIEIMRIVRCNDRNVQLARDLHKARVDHFFLGHAVAHDLNIETVAEDVDERLGRALCFLEVVFQQRRSDQTGHAA